jgi:hypothetical protein
VTPGRELSRIRFRLSSRLGAMATSASGTAGLRQRTGAAAAANGAARQERPVSPQRKQDAAEEKEPHVLGRTPDGTGECSLDEACWRHCGSLRRLRMYSQVSLAPS